MSAFSHVYSPSLPAGSYFYGRRKWNRLLGRQPRLLIVEDNRDILTSLAKWFASDGWSSHGATDGSAFFHLVSPVLEGESAGPNFDVIITDIAMPGVDVVTILEGLRQIGCEVPVVAISALPDPELPGRIEALGRSRFFAKPFSIAEVHRVARRLLLESLRECTLHGPEPGLKLSYE